MSHLKQEDITRALPVVTGFLVNRFNHSISTMLQDMTGYDSNNARLDSEHNCQFEDFKGVKVYVSVSPDLSIQVERLKRKLFLRPKGASYELIKPCKTSREHALDIAAALNVQMSRGGLTFKKASGQYVHNGHSAGLGHIGDLQDRSYVSRQNVEGSASAEAREALGLDN